MKHQPFLYRLRYALHGIRLTLSTEASFQFQFFCALLVFSALFYFQATPVWWALCSLSVAGVLSTELLNTALEKLMDHLHPEVHPSIKIAKDCAAGGVLVFSFFSIVVFVCFIADQF